MRWITLAIFLASTFVFLTPNNSGGYDHTPQTGGYRSKVEGPLAGPGEGGSYVPKRGTQNTGGYRVS